MRPFGIFLIILGLAGILLGIAIFVALIDDPQRSQFAAIAFAVGVGGGLVVAIVGGFMARAAKPKAAPALGGRTGSFLPDQFESRSVSGISYEVHYQTPVTGKNGRPSKLLIRVSASSPTTLRFLPESLLDRLGKFLRIASEVQTGDAEFDNAIYIRGLDDEYVSEFLAHADVRRSILTLFSENFREVRLTGEHCEAEWVSFVPEKNDRPGLCDEVAVVLAKMSQRRPTTAFVARPRDTSYRWCVILWVFLIAFAATAASLFVFPPLRGWDLFKAGLGDFGWYYGMFLLLAAILLRGTSISHDRWFPLAFFGFFLIAIGTFGAMEAINALGDHHPFDNRIAIVTSKRSSSGKHGTNYHVSVAAWDRKNEHIEFSVNSHDYHRIVPHRSKMHLQIGRGRLGIPWIKHQAIEP
jgi:hypothetical protein